MPTIAQCLRKIREAIYGRDVREAIASGIEQCYSDVSNSITIAHDAADMAVAETNERIEAALQQASQAVNNANTAAHNADTSAQAAETAKAETETATQNANAAIVNARRAEQAALEAAETADTNAGYASRAGDKAEEAVRRLAAMVQDAELATGNANTAAQNADRITAAAQAAVEDANEAAAQAREAFNDIDEIRSRFVADIIQDGERFCGVNDKGEQITPWITGVGGSGGGSGGGSTVINTDLQMESRTGWTSKQLHYDEKNPESVPLTVYWTSTLDEVPTGTGVLTVTIGGATVIRRTNVPQGEVTVDVGPYLGLGSNNVRVVIQDAYQKTTYRVFDIYTVMFSLSSSFDQTLIRRSSFELRLTPSGRVDRGTSKTIYISLDGRTPQTLTAASDTELSFTVPAQSHGAHTIEAWFEGTLNTETLESNHLHFNYMYVVNNSTEPIAMLLYSNTTLAQYSQNTLYYRVYQENAQSVAIDIYEDGVKSAEVTVSRDTQEYSFRANTPGEKTVAIKVGNITLASVTYTITASDVEIDVEAVSTGLALHLTAEGRSNNEANPATWTDGSIACQFTGFNKRLGGWMTDKDGLPMLRLVDDMRVEVPLQIFGESFLNEGKTIEIEFAARDVFDFSSPIISCFSGNRGLQVTSDTILFKGAQEEISTTYKEEEHLRLGITIEPQQQNRLVCVYLDGILSRCTQYASGEQLHQLSPVNLTLGSNDASLDIYNIRVYNKCLSAKEILNNRTADTLSGPIKYDLYMRNRIYDESGNLTIESLQNASPNNLPYMVIEVEEMPPAKGEKRTATVRYVDPVNPAKSFTATGVEIDAQGTSSSVYFRKNTDMKFKQGFELASGHADKYALKENSYPNNRFVLKADVASSESANNTVISSFFSDNDPYKTPQQLADSRIRQAIEGIPIVMFHYKPSTREYEFLGKQNFNLPKRAPGPLGYSQDETMESWEFERNNSDNVKFKSFDITTWVVNTQTGERHLAWYDDWEARFPDDTWRDTTRLGTFVQFIMSTDQDQATNEALPENVVYTLGTTITIDRFLETDSSFTTEMNNATGEVTVTFTKDTPAYRLTKFRVEFPEYAELTSFTWYYILTDLFLMIDSRAKNMFIGFRGSPITFTAAIRQVLKAVAEMYDADTGLGTNNTGILTFPYYLEDIDRISDIIAGTGTTGSDAPVYNAQDSVLWVNFRQAFWAEIRSMFASKLSDGTLTYDNIIGLFEAHQSKWSEAIVNEDAKTKYIYPLLHAVTKDEYGNLIRTTQYLPMIHGLKTYQRRGWLAKRLAYKMSQFDCGDAVSRVVYMRLFASGTLHIKMALNMYATVVFGGGSTPIQERVAAGEDAAFEYAAPSGVTEMETWIRSANMITDLGDLSIFYPNELSLAQCSRLRNLKFGDGAVGYENRNMRTLDTSNLPMLLTIDGRNCPRLTTTINLEKSTRLRSALFEGSAITGIDIPDGCPVTTLHLPGTITTLVLQNLDKLTDLQIPDYSHVTRLMLANMDDSIINPVSVLSVMEANSEVNIQGLNLEMQDAAAIEAFLDLLDNFTGTSREWVVDDQGVGRWNYIHYATAQVSGAITTESLTGAQVASYNSRYPYLTVSPRHITCTVTFKSFDGATVLGTKTSTDYADVDDSGISASRSQSDKYTYTKVGWALTPSSGIEPNANKADPDALKNIAADRTVYAAYTGTLRSYPIYFALSSDDGGGTLESKTLTYGSQATYTGATPTTTKGSATDYPFQGWSPALGQVTGSVTYYAVFGSPKEIKEIADSWDTIFAALDDGTYKTKYKVGNYKAFDLGTEGSGQLNFIGLDKDECANGTGTAPISCAIGFVLNTTHRMNPPKVANTEGTGALGGWDKSEMKTYVTTGIWAKIPAEVRARIVPVKKYTRICQASDETVVNNVETTETVYLLSRREVGSSSNKETMGPEYTGFFSDNESRKMRKSGSGSATTWLLRSANNSNYFCCVNAVGNPDYPYEGNNQGVLIAFCLGTYEQLHTKSGGLAALKASMQAGTYATDYAPGDLIPIENDGENSANYVQIMGFNMNPKADGSGNAKVAAAYYYCLPTSKRMNPARVANTEGTGALGGWEKTEMRDYLRNTIYPAMQNDLKELIVPVKKYTKIIRASDETSVNDVETIETVYFLSRREVAVPGSGETTGPVYATVFSSDASRKRRNCAKTYSSAWWLRSVSSVYGFHTVNSGGALGYNNADVVYRMLIAFDLDIDNLQ